MTNSSHSETAPVGPKLHTGGCHCGAVRYQVQIDARNGSRCNCSICNKVAQLGGIVAPAAFTLLAGAESSTQYTWRTKTASRVFCKHCGVHCYGHGHIPELGGDFVSINYNTLDDVDPSQVNVVYWDGRHDNWEAGPRPAPWPIAALSLAQPAA